MIERVIKSLMDRGIIKEPSEFQKASFDPVEPRVARSLACDLLVIAVGPEGSQLPSGTTAIDWMLRAALLVELRFEGRIEVEGAGRKATATVCNPQALGDPELDSALRDLNTGGTANVMRKADVMPGTRRLADRLLGEGLLVEESSTRLGVFTKTRLLPTPLAGREELMDRLASALRGGPAPDERTALLIAIFDEFLGYASLVATDQLDEAQRAGDAIVANLQEDYRVLIGAVGFAKSKADPGGDISAV